MSHCSDFISGSGRAIMGGGMFGIGFLWWVFIVVAMIGVSYMLRNDKNQSKPQNIDFSDQKYGKQSSAIDILDQEFAKGNLTEEEYMYKKELIKK